MSPLTIGMYVLLALGIATALVALMIFLREKGGIKRPVAAALFAVLLLGLGTFGLAFMDPYTRLLGVLIGTRGDAADTPKYQAFFSDVADGKADDEHAGVGIAHTLSNPVPDMDKLLKQAIRTGTSDAGKQRLRSVLAALREKDIEAARAIEEASPGSGVASPDGVKTIEVSKLDPGVRKVVEHRLATIPREELSKLALDPKLRKAIEARRPK